VLDIRSAPLTLGVGAAPPFPIEVVIRDGEGVVVNAENVDITIVTATLGSVGGISNVRTSKTGVAVFADFTLDTPGTTTLTLEAAALGLQVQLTMRAGAFPHTCTTEDTKFATSQGGCKDLQSGLVWSVAPVAPMTWHNAIWDSANPMSPPSPEKNSPPEISDGVRTNDYFENSAGMGVDRSLINYCHELTEGGADDWRVPTLDELDALLINNAAERYFSFNVDSMFWSSNTSIAAGGNRADVKNLFTGITIDVGWPKSLQARVVCVRKGS